MPADGLTVTVALGASAYDARFGLPAHRPIRLRRDGHASPTTTWTGRICDGDLLLRPVRRPPRHRAARAARHHRATPVAACSCGGGSTASPELPAPDRRAPQPARLQGRHREPRRRTTRSEMDALVWTNFGSGEPAWAVGGSYQVIRVIRMLVEFWDRVSIEEQERMFGRRKDSGAPLSGQTRPTTRQYVNDALGATIPLDAHIRLANPRTHGRPRPPDPAPRLHLRQGHRQPTATSTSAWSSPASSRISTGSSSPCRSGWPASRSSTTSRPVGGGYFFALPGVRTVRLVGQGRWPTCLSAEH